MRECGRSASLTDNQRLSDIPLRPALCEFVDMHRGAHLPRELAQVIMMCHVDDLLQLRYDILLKFILRGFLC